MRKKNRLIKTLTALLPAFVMASCAMTAHAEDTPPYDGSLRIEEGTLLPMCEYSDPRDPEYSNEKSDILRFCVYVETDNDTDNDGMADLVKALVQVPRSAVEGKYKAATIYDPTPYGAGTYEKAYSNPELMFNKIPDPELIRNAGPLPEFEDEYYEEYLFILENADLFKESIQLIGGVELMDTSVPAEEGNKIQFETTDLNGNTVRSEDLFAGHILTMINLWATWCSPCKAELPDLEKLNQELSEKNCQIIGIVTDTDKDEKISKAKLILEKNGVTYLNLVTFEGLSDLLPQVSWPTSYFVEEDGTLFGEPVVGISMDNYLKVFDAIEYKQEGN